MVQRARKSCRFETAVECGRNDLLQYKHLDKASSCQRKSPSLMVKSKLSSMIHRKLDCWGVSERLLFYSTHSEGKIQRKEMMCMGTNHAQIAFVDKICLLNLYFLTRNITPMFHTSGSLVRCFLLFLLYFL